MEYNMINKKQKQRDLVKTRFKLWVLDELVDGKLDREIAGNMICDESFDEEGGLVRWIDAYGYFTKEQEEKIVEFANDYRFYDGGIE
jgi:hypothetical protein|tara:strand:- start:198 stop:458 length:261 start_codon:yes stop_codon:yes gene_type:complete